MLLLALKILTTLKNAGYTAYFAGGAVRDFKLKKEPKDIDIATSAKPEEIERIFSNTKPIGKEFGVMLVILDKIPFDVTTFRADIGSKKGRWPESVKFADEKTDSKRRDFTVNGMFLNIENSEQGEILKINEWKKLEKKLNWEIIDYNEGLNDCVKKILRFIGDPRQRIDEDYLRILRAVRLKNEFDFAYEDETKKALINNAKLVNGLSDERVREELQKGLISRNRRKFFEELSEFGILEFILPEIEDLKNIEQGGEHHHEGNVFVHTMMALGAVKDKPINPLVLWAILFHDIGKKETASKDDRGVPHWFGHEKVSAEKAMKIMKRLKFSRKEIKAIKTIIINHSVNCILSKMGIGKRRELFLNQYGRPTLDLMIYDDLGKIPKRLDRIKRNEKYYKEAQKFGEKLKKEFGEYLKGSFVMEVKKIKPGPRVGEVIKKLKLAILDEKVKTEEEIINFIKSIN